MIGTIAGRATTARALLKATSVSRRFYAAIVEKEDLS